MPRRIVFSASIMVTLDTPKTTAMPTKLTSDGYRSISYPKQSLLRDYILHQSAIRNKNLAGLTIGGKLEGMFVENEILVNARNERTIDFLINKLEGEVIPPKPLPPKPRGFESRRARSLEGMPQIITVKIKGENVPLDSLDHRVNREVPEGLVLSSHAGAGTLAAMELLKENNLGGHLNFAGNPTGFPLLSSTENIPGLDSNAFNWPEYAGKSNISRAWQLCQAFDNVKSMQHPVFIGILDVGFGFVTPFDYATGPQFNLTNEGSSISGPTSIGSYKWHGSAVAGVAAAVINNSIGSGGVAGLPVGAANQPVAIPFMFRTNIVISEIYRCLDCCLAWGIDVLNMSFSITVPKIALPINRDWEDKFQFATNQGLVMIASAANHGSELPDKAVFPATRTPGVITVGALDSSGNNAKSNSNYGSSVDVWAPGENIHTVPDPDTNPVFFNDTSAAAPVVSGVAALLLSVNPSLKPDNIKAILRDTAFTDSPDWKSNRILNAYAAVLKAMNFALPAGTFEEPNDTVAAAKDLKQTSPNVWEPLGETVISRQSDTDYHRFSTTQYADIVVTLDFVRPLSIVVMEVLPDDPDSLLFNDFTESRTTGKHVLSFKQAPPGSYRIKVFSQEPNYYKLRVNVTPKPLTPDIFEWNGTKEAAAIIKLRNANPPFDLTGAHTFYQGSYQANILEPADVDWFSITDITHHVLSVPCFQLISSDQPLDVNLYGPDGTLLSSFSQIKQGRVQLPEADCWVEVRGLKTTRYSINFGYYLDKSKLPGPHQKEDIEIVPKWWPDPPFVINEWEKWLEVVIDEELSKHGQLELQGDTALQLDLLSPQRSLIQSAKANGQNTTVLNVKGIAPGKYLLRVARPEGAAARFEASQKAIKNFSIGPAF